MRRALNVRDQGCIVCAAPPAMCEAHHVVHWADGGETRLTNLALLCKRHHIDVHQGHWTLTTSSGRPTTNRPPWTSPPRPTTHSSTTPARPTTHSPTTPAHPTTHSPTTPAHSTAHSPTTPAATPPSRPPPHLPDPTLS
ncbi:HNH endonuclease signature motif containing protein [Kribbella endophytica]